MSDLSHDCDVAVRAAMRAGADGAEAFALDEWGASAEVEKDSLTHAEAGASRGLGLRVLKDARVGFAFATRPDMVDQAVTDALKAARLSKRTPAFEFPRARKHATLRGVWDARLAELEGPDLLEGAGTMIDAVKDVRKDLRVAGGSVNVGQSECAVVNSEGVDKTHRETSISAHLYVIQSRDGVSTGFSHQEATRYKMAWQGLGKEAGELAVASAKPAKLDGAGPRICLVRPDPAADLLTTITIPSLYARPAHRGESYYTGKVGKRVMHEKISLVDDPTLPASVGSVPFDDEGTPTKVVKPVAGGVLKTFLYDALDAAEYKGKPTGHALRMHSLDGRSFKASPHTSANQVRLVAPSTTTAKLVAGIDDGLLLHDMMGVHTANAVSGDFSVNASIVFRVRKGAVEGPVAPLSVAGNLHQALKRGLRLGDDVKTVGGAPSVVLPTVLFEGFTATP